MRFSENFTVTALNVALMISTVRLARNDDLDASDSIVQIGRNDDSEAFVSILQIDHLLSRNGLRCVFHHKSSKMLL